MWGAIIFNIIFWGLILLFEIYAYRKKVWRVFKNPNLRKWGHGIYVFATVLCWACVALMFFYFREERNFWSNITLGTFLTLWVTKVFLFVFFVISDIYLIAEVIGQKIRKEDELPSRVASRRKFIKKLGLIVSTLPFISMLFSITKGKYFFKVREQEVVFKDLPEAFNGFRVLQFSDFHAGTFDSYEGVKKGIELMRDQKPDLILYTGDLVNSVAEEVDPFDDLFQLLEAPYGKYAVLGNHDYGYWGRHRGKVKKDKETIKREIREKYQTIGLELLNNRNVRLEKGGESIHVVGVENWGKSHYFPKKGDLDVAYHGMNENDFSILMSHDPSHWDEKIVPFQRHVHLTLSGHTHGAQIGFEFAGFRWSPSKYAYPRWAGLYKEAGQYLYVNRGFGMLDAFPLRIGIFPEITILKLVRG